MFSVIDQLSKKISINNKPDIHEDNLDIDSMLNDPDLMSGAISEKELNTASKVGELGDKLKHLEMKDILDIDIDMDN